MKQIFLYGMILLICSCSISTTESKWIIHKGISLSETKMEIRYPSNLAIDSEVYINAYFQNPKYRLHSAFINCPLDSVSIFDSTRVTIKGCEDHLFIRDDSVQIYFKVTKEHSKNFSIGKATILFKNNEDKFFAADTVIGFSFSN